MFEKKYTPQNIQQEILQKQNRKKLFANKEIKKAGEKNTVSLLASPIILDQEHTSYGQLLQKIKEDSMARYRRMLGKQVQWYPCFGYQKSNKA